MKPISELDLLVKSTHVDGVVAYLLDHGWVEAEKRPHGTIFAGPLADSGSPIVLGIPASEQQADFYLRVEDALRTLSVLEQRPMEAILRDMLARKTEGAASEQPARPRRA